MVRKFFSKNLDVFSHEEEVAMASLVAARRHLVFDGDRVDTESEAGFDACAGVLDALAVVADLLKAEMAPRRFRDDFTVNYRSLFPDDARHYRVDVLEASIDRYVAIWVNGDKFEFSVEAMCRAKALHRAWTMLISLLDRWDHSKSRCSHRPTRSEFRSALAIVDFAWAGFEQRYISELIAIEQRARSLIVQATQLEQRLQELESRHEGKTHEALYSHPEYFEVQKDLIRCVSHLNSVANVRRKGRDDLSASVLYDALVTLRQCDEAERACEASEVYAAARVLATDIVESYDAMRSYFRMVSSRLDSVDPHLCNNAGLVDRLANWEESWETGMRYVQNPMLLHSLCDLVAHIQHVLRLVPAFAIMFQNFDAELFMILPRLVWLRFLTQPKKHFELMRSLVPVAKDGNLAFDALAEKFQHTKRELAAAVQKPDGMGAEDAVWDFLVESVVRGSAGSVEPQRVLPQCGASVRKTVEDLVLALEPWSIELQRHCPEDWNQYSAIIVRCLNGGSTATGHAPSAEAEEPFLV